MIKVIYNNIENELGTNEEVLELVKRINQEKLVEQQLVVIERQDLSVLEIALGMGQESVMFYIPASEEDIIVSCNELVDRAKTEAVKVTHALEEEVECTSCNIVPFDSAINTLEAFLQGKEFINFVDWYVY